MVLIAQICLNSLSILNSYHIFSHSLFSDTEERVDLINLKLCQNHQKVRKRFLFWKINRFSVRLKYRKFAPAMSGDCESLETQWQRRIQSSPDAEEARNNLNFHRTKIRELNEQMVSLRGMYQIVGCIENQNFSSNFMEFGTGS